MGAIQGIPAKVTSQAKIADAAKAAIAAMNTFPN